MGYGHHIGGSEVERAVLRRADQNPPVKLIAAEFVAGAKVGDTAKFIQW